MCEGTAQLFLVDESGEVVSRDIPRVLGSIKCTPEAQGFKPGAGYNAAVMRVKRLFSEEVKHRQAERGHSMSLSQGQRYVIRELRVIFGVSKDEDTKGQINILEKAFRAPLTAAVSRELSRIRRNGITGVALMRLLTDIYHQHNMHEWAGRRSVRIEDSSLPRVICSEGLI